MIRLRDIALSPEHNAHQLQFEAARMLGIPNSKVRQLRIVRRSVDARKKPDVKIIYTVDVAVEGNEKKILRQSGCKRAAPAPVSYYVPPKPSAPPAQRPVVIGFGPAGMFAALILSLAGWKPLVLERGEDAKTRHETVERFFTGGELNPASNVQFGEGGAGTFSDGKLNTGVNNPRIHWILEQFVKAGAGEDILYDAKPHVGTDVLLTVVQTFSYGFIILISLLSAANVFNTISTNIALRRRDYAMLGSIGLGRKGLIRMMNYECLIYGLHALLIGLPLSVLASIGIRYIVEDMVESVFDLPWIYFAIAALSVFVVVFSSMLYSYAKLKKDSPVETLKDENI